MIINGIEQRNYEHTLVPRSFELQGGLQWKLNQSNSVTIQCYQYNHDYRKLYHEFELDPRLPIERFTVTNGEQALYKGIPMRYRWNAVIKEMMMTGKYRIKYRGVSKKSVGYKRKQNYCLAEYADTFAIYNK